MISLNSLNTLNPNSEIPIATMLSAPPASPRQGARLRLALPTSGQARWLLRNVHHLRLGGCCPDKIQRSAESNT
eukprot:8186029-Lingulodinium_polyedra.AAC.1